MSLISRTGTFRGVVLDNGLAESSGGYPQLRLSLAAEEYYDTQEREWVDWSAQDEQTQAFLVVFGEDVKKALFHARAIKDVFGWSGQDFVAFNSPDWAGTQIQFRVEENEYNGTVSLQVQAINTYDAVPGQISKADEATVKRLEAKYAAGLRALGGTKIASAKTVKTEKPAVPKTNAIPAPITGGEETTTEETTTDTGPPELPANGVVSPPLTPEEKAGKTTKSKAWRALVKQKDEYEPEMGDEDLSEIWTNAVLEVAPDKKGKNLTGEEWFKVQVLASRLMLDF